MKDSENLQKAIESLGGEFELVKELGRGATSVVYQLRDNALDRDLAMKVIRTTLGGDEEAVARLQREARLVAQLLHPNIVKLYGTHRLPDGSLALLMEHVPGRNLKEVLRAEGPLSVPRTIGILKEVGSALAYAHRRRIVHRDVKPENIYIDEEVGSARLADFGVARPWDQDARLTLPGASLGTPAYMAPEQIDGLEVDGRTDVYSLGLVGYEMILGHHPWEGENVFTIIFRQKNEELPIGVLNLQDAPALARTLERSLSKNPASRPESAMAFLEELADDVGAEQEMARRASQEPQDPDPSPIPPPKPVESKEAPLPPVDWSAVEGTSEEGPPPEIPVQDDREVGEFVATRPLALPPQKQRWGAILAIVAIILTVGTFGVLQLLPDRGGISDPAAFTPIPTAPPSNSAPPTAEPVALEGGDVPAGVTLADGALTTGPVGTLLEFSTQFHGDSGLPLVDTLVTFAVAGGGGEIAPLEARTDTDGRVAVEIQLPTTPGVTSILVGVAGAPALQGRFEFSAGPGPGDRMDVLIGDGQTANPGEPLEEFLGIRVTDSYGNPVPDQEVRFQIPDNAGRVSPALVQTDDRGRGFARWTLGPTEGSQEVTAVIPGNEAVSVVFRATSEAPAEQSIQTDPPGAVPDGPPAQDSADQEEATTDPLPPAPEPVVVVARTFTIGGSHVCHLSGGSAVCRGANDRGQGGNRSLSGLVAIAAGVSHGCGLSREGEAWCWGANESGQLGDGTTADDRSGALVDTDTRFSALATGLSHTCGLGADGTALCWGRNVYGQLGDGSRSDHIRPQPVSGGQAFREIVSGWNHTCGLVAGSQALCWGSSSDGQLGDGLRVDRLAPTLVPGNFRALAAGANHTCGIRGEAVVCWGDNAFGQLGDGTTEDRPTPTPVIGLPASPRAVATGAVHSCALLSDGSIHCWGQNLHGQLGDGTRGNRAVPAPISGETRFLSVSAGGGVTCGFAQDGSEFCWGLNQSGQLGDGSRTNRTTPVRVGGN